MPTYCYRRKDNGQIVELVMSAAEMSQRQKDGCIRLPDGAIAERDMQAEHGGFKDTPGNWPLLSDAAGVHPSQIQEASSHALQVGVPTNFAPDGRAIFTSREHRRRYCQAIGFHDRNGGYGDP